MSESDGVKRAFRLKPGIKYEVLLGEDSPITIIYEDGSHQHIKISELILAFKALLDKHG